MTAGAPWSVKGIDPKAREVAKDLARRSGMTLGEWLNRVILEDDGSENPLGEAAHEPPVPERPLRAAYEAPRLVSATPSTAAPAPTSGQDFGQVAQALDRLTNRIDASETRTGLAISGVEHSVRQALARIEAAEREHLALTDRLARIETDPAGPRSVEALRMLETRLARIEAAAGFDAAALDARLQETERRAAQVVEGLGQQVLAMAEAVNRRLVAAEQQSAGALEQVGGEIARVAGAVEARLARAEQAQAESLERFGAEIGRITDNLSERLSGAERRTAQAIDDVGQQVARVSERIEQRHERAAGDLAERIRQSEARTQRLLDEARARLGGEPLPMPEPSAPDSFVAEPYADEAEPPRGPFGPELFSRAEPMAEAAVDPVRPSFAAEDFDAAEAFVPLAELEDDEVFEAVEAEPEVADGARPLSTREVIDRARAAARAAQAAPKPVEVRAKLDRRQASGRLFNGFGVAKPRRRQSTALHTALMVAGSAAFLSVGAAGVVLMNGPQGGEEGAPAAPIGESPRAAAAFAPTSTASSEPAAETSADPAEAAFVEAVRAAEAGRPGGLAELKAVAEDGYAPAQFYLAQLYESGRLGVVQNLAEARRWTARAAEGGEPNAMHNLGLYFFRGEGGPQDLASAAQWFRKAAEAGVVDSQYNLGLMYQAGSGVQRDPAEALKWFSLAAAQGDGLARTAAEGLKAKLAPAA
ncbi:localization factor podJL (Polar organelle development protein) [Phenylobacterium zucineum HLK1]|uniref:Localization factor podJL (Polar organelle development protein) n=1 Tax=Phenylobacterium zucineum (strain HLK1) TaxID=450851 RepID=B4R861_PHEZH|nr:SEL1-like repeat protein [Phenylobacterium zucineum]ACG79179.1 localization factor podJL (Polar organelle development protein) [Phenylobacterium zucineum HLK1]